eukprot:TRINITY_DN937_c0_g1_i1.p1 TRINITY_DN937_c0_g1~~TRINITY_DN937_c0_g1_i1.p1  ORF type:complete len:212 (-),score=51.45 TRINITY_DN937_c0_g1_i1:269-856(-)
MSEDVPATKEAPKEEKKGFMENVQNQFKKGAEDFDESLKAYPWLTTLEEKTKVKKVYLVLGALAFVGLFVLFGFGANPLSNLVGFVYPLYASFKAVKSPQTDDDSQWLTYWVVYGFFTLIESFTDFFLNWLPLYYVWKMAFLVYCFAFRGASMLYTKGLSRLFAMLEPKQKDDKDDAAPKESHRIPTDEAKTTTQ